MAGIVSYASLQMGEKIGDGECTRLVEAALVQAGKKTTRDFGVVGNTKDYVWGTPVTIHTAVPGDIIQFRNHIMSITTKKKDHDGSGVTVENKRAHHTAIIANKGWRMDDYNREYFVFSIIEQNHPARTRTVKSHVQFQKSDVTAANGDEILTESTGEYWIYRPVAA